MTQSLSTCNRHCSLACCGHQMEAVSSLRSIRVSQAPSRHLSTIHGTTRSTQVQFRQSPVGNLIFLLSFFPSTPQLILPCIHPSLFISALHSVLPLFIPSFRPSFRPPFFPFIFGSSYPSFLAYAHPFFLPSFRLSFPLYFRLHCLPVLNIAD